MDDATPESPFDLVIVHAGGMQRVPLLGRVVVGRGEDAGVRVPDPRLSRLHCRFQLDDDLVKVTDLGSSNGTRLGEQEISQIRIGHGRRLDLSPDTSVWIVDGGAEIPLPAPAAAAPAKRRELAPQAPESAPAARPARTSAAVDERPVPVLAAAPREAPARRAAAGREGIRRFAPIAVLAVLVVAVIVIASRPDPARLAASAWAEVKAQGERRAFDDAIRSLDALVQTYPETGAAAEARADRERLVKLAAARGRSLETMRQLLASVERQPLAEILRQIDDLAEKAGPALMESEVADARDRASKASAEIAKRLVDALEPALRSAVTRSEFASAARLLAEAEQSFFLDRNAESRLAIHRQQLEAAARSAVLVALREAESLPLAQRALSIDAALPRFAGLAEEGRLRAHRRLFAEAAADAARAAAAAANSGAGRPATEVDVQKPRVSEAAASALAEAEALVATRRFGAAADALERALALPDLSGAEELKARVERLRRAEAVRSAILGKIQSDRRAFARIRVGPELYGNVREADQDTIELVVGEGARVKWWWSRISAERLEELVTRASLYGDPSVDAAILFLEWGAPDRALRALARSFDREPQARARAEELVREARGLREVPAGGFVVHDGQLLTVGEHQVALRKAALSLAASKVRAGLRPELASAVAKLEAAGDEGRELLVPALEDRLAGIEARVLALEDLQPAKLRALQGVLYEEMERRRAAALELIFDSKRYPYPYASNQAEIQGEVDQLVQRVRVLWESPSKEVAERIQGFAELATEGEEVTAHMERLNLPGGGKGRIARALDERLALKAYRAHPDAEKLHAHAQKVRDHDQTFTDTEVKPEERACHEATNAYRLMLGRRAVMISPELVVAARGHSQEMKDLGYFAHESPVPGRKSPSDRARLAGFGSGVSENIARGQANGRAAVQGWIGSSGHHRNLLGERWTHLGCGQADGDTFWTQNFGSGAAEPPDRPRR